MLTRIFTNALIAPADYIPKKILRIGVKCLGIFWDSIDKLQLQKFDLLPPLSVRMQANSNIRMSSYKKYGEFYLNYLIKNCRLKKNGKILDVGCGSGILATPLTKYLDSQGLYEGFDLNKQLIDWCQANVTSVSKFNFRAINVYNGNIISRQYKPYKF